jgi:hypothetical protein
VTLTTYAGLQTAVATWLKRDNLTSYIPDLITLAENQIDMDVAVFNQPLRALEQTQTGTLSGSTLAIPTGYRGMKRFSISFDSSTNIVLEYVAPEKAGRYATASISQFYTTNGDNFEIVPPPNSSYSYSLVYLKKLDSIITSSTNWILSNFPNLYLYGALCHAAPFLKDDARIPIWQGMYAQALKALEMANNKDRTSGSTLRMKSDVRV